MSRNFPLVQPVDDVRFTFGLIDDIAERLTVAGYPKLTGHDYMELHLALFTFLYTDRAERAC